MSAGSSPRMREAVRTAPRPVLRVRSFSYADLLAEDLTRGGGNKRCEYPRAEYQYRAENDIQEIPFRLGDPFRLAARENELESRVHDEKRQDRKRNLDDGFQECRD